MKPATTTSRINAFRLNGAPLTAYALSAGSFRGYKVLLSADVEVQNVPEGLHWLETAAEKEQLRAS